MNRRASAQLSAYERDFFRQYMETALWSSTDDDGNPLGRDYSVSDIAASSQQSMRHDCLAFITANEADLFSPDAQDAERAGHDFWLTRNGHGAGFWDGDWPKAMAKRLTRSSKNFGESSLLVGDDGFLYIYPERRAGGKRRHSPKRKHGRLSLDERALRLRATLRRW